MNYDEMSTDELLNIMPDNLLLMRNDNKEPEKRWRLYNTLTKKRCSCWGLTARDLMIKTLKDLDWQLRSWTGR